MFIADKRCFVLVCTWVEYTIGEEVEVEFCGSKRELASSQSVGCNCHVVTILLFLTLPLLSQNAETLKNLLVRHKDYFPTEDDRLGAMQAILRLQQTYRIPSNKFSSGHIGTHALSLTSDDCQRIAEFAYHHMDDYAAAVLWFREAVRLWPRHMWILSVGRNSSEEKEKLVRLLYYLSYSEWQVSPWPWMALTLGGQGNIHVAFDHCSTRLFSVVF